MSSQKSKAKTEMEQTGEIETLKTELENLKKENTDLMNYVEPVMSELHNLRRQMEKLSTKDNVERDLASDWEDDGWSMPKTPSDGSSPPWEGWVTKSEIAKEYEKKKSREEGGSKEEGSTTGEQGVNEDDGNEGDGDNSDNENAPDNDNEVSSWRNNSPTTIPDDNECDDGVDDDEWADDSYTPSAFYRRLNMLSPHQVSLPRLDQVEDFDAWDRALRELCKFLQILDTLDGSPNWNKTVSENVEEQDWLEFTVSQSLSAQFKRTLEAEVAGEPVSQQYRFLKEQIPDRRRFRRAQLLAQLERLSAASSGHNPPEYLEQFLSIREKLLGLGEEGKVPEPTIYRLFYAGLRGQAFYSHVVQYETYQRSRAEGYTLLSFANFAGHLLQAIPEEYY